jgi:transcriptional regulator with XRE-family HTH domain
MIGDRLKKLREEQKVTQIKLAEILNISRDTYAQYEIDRRVPEYGTLEKLADYFDVSLDYLVGRSNYRHIIRSGEELERVINLSDDKALEKIPMYSDGKELSNEQKKSFIALFRGIQAAQRDLEGNH